METEAIWILEVRHDGMRDPYTHIEMMNLPEGLDLENNDEVIDFVSGFTKFLEKKLNCEIGKVAINFGENLEQIVGVSE